MKVDVYNQKGEKTGEVSLPKEVFGVSLNSDLIHQVAISQTANQRRVIAHTKGRGEVRGGGAKPWRQKGTGRARHGSNRSPIWIGGGVTFGPTKERKFEKKIPLKMKRKALFMIFSDKLKNNLLIVLDEFQIKEKKTKKIVEVLEKLPCGKESCLIGLPECNNNIILAARNIPKVFVKEVRNLNVLDLLSAKYLLIPKDSIKVIKETFLAKSSKSNS